MNGNYSLNYIQLLHSGIVYTCKLPKIHVSGHNSDDVWAHFDANARIFIINIYIIIYFVTKILISI